MKEPRIITCVLNDTDRLTRVSYFFKDTNTLWVDEIAHGVNSEVNGDWNTMSRKKIINGIIVSDVSHSNPSTGFVII